MGSGGAHDLGQGHSMVDKQRQAVHVLVLYSTQGSTGSDGAAFLQSVLKAFCVSAQSRNVGYLGAAKTTPCMRGQPSNPFDRTL